MLEAARSYFSRGWAAIPLTYDDQGKPKRPFTDDWQRTPLLWEHIEQLPWDRAVGIGILLGPVSGNLGVIDLDDVELANEVRAALEGGNVDHYWVETGRKNGHLYIIEPQPSAPAYLPIEYHGRELRIELKAMGQQVAAPPTPGYTSLWGDTPYRADGGLLGTWNAIASRLGLPAASVSRSAGSSHYPRPWGENVSAGERNSTLYVEAHRLREAGLTQQQAVDILTTRVRSSYDDGGFPDAEIRRTVQSAYRKGERKVHVGWM